MNPKLTNTLLAFVGTFLSALVAAKIVPSAMTTMTWIDTCWTVGLQSAFVAVGTYMTQTAPVQRLMGR